MSLPKQLGIRKRPNTALFFKPLIFEDTLHFCP